MPLLQPVRGHTEEDDGNEDCVKCEKTNNKYGNRKWIWDYKQIPENQTFQ